MEGWTIAAVVIAVVSVLVAVWQGWTSKQQLVLAKQTETRTEKALEAIRTESAETRRIVQDIKSNVDDRITKMLDTQVSAEHQRQANAKTISDALTAQLLGGLGKNLGGQAPSAE